LTTNNARTQILLTCLATVMLLLCTACGTQPPASTDTDIITPPVVETPAPTESTAEESLTAEIKENKLGTVDGYDYELWKDNGTTTMTLDGGGTFSCKWSDINNALFRIGKKFDCTKTWDEFGNICVEYSAKYAPVGNSYLCVYGWTREPLIEYYVVQSWGNWRPPGAESLGTITVGDATYDIYETTRVEQPSIDGTATFQQYWSVRKGKCTEGTIDLTAHFRAWEEMGMELGKLYEIALTVEGYQSSGAAQITKNEIIIGSEG